MRHGMSIQELQYWRFQPFRSQSCIWREPCKLFEYMEGELASGTTAFKKKSIYLSNSNEIRCISAKCKIFSQLFKCFIVFSISSLSNILALMEVFLMYQCELIGLKLNLNQCYMHYLK